MKYQKYFKEKWILSLLFDILSGILKNSENLVSQEIVRFVAISGCVFIRVIFDMYL